MNKLIATAALLLSVASPARAEVLGDMGLWDQQWGLCLADPTHVARTVEVPQNFEWLNECTISLGAVRYRMVVHERWWQPFMWEACALAGGLATCRDYISGLYGCFADTQPAPFLYLVPCTPAHWQLWQPPGPPVAPPQPMAPPMAPRAPRYDTEPPTLDRG